jgi:bacillithiol synthase
MKIERVVHPAPFGHPLNAMLKAWKEPWLADHYAFPPTIEGLRRAAAMRQQNVARAPVVAMLAQKNARLQNVHATRLCEERARPDALVVACGQQPGLFGGALLSFEKAAGAVNLAARLTADLGVPVVPVFWNQSEDHDLEEVNRLEIQRADGVTRLRAPIEDLGRTLDSIVIDDGVVAFARDALVECGLDAGPVSDLLPLRGERFSEWTSRILVHVFGDSGLLVAEPSWFRGMTTPIVRRAIVEARALHDAFAGSTEELRAHGVEPQVEVRDRSMLFRVDQDGTRRRLFLRDGGWEEDKTGQRFTEHDLLDRLEAHPAGFSTNVQLRAAVQQMLFPVVAQIGGPAEVAYFAQFPKLFAALGLPLPPMVVRPESTILGPKEAALREALAIGAVDLLRGPAAWPASGDDARIAVLGETLAAAHAELVARVRKAATNDALLRAVDGYEKSLALADEKITGTFRRDREREAGVITGRRARLEQWVFPRGKPQDRVYGILSAMGRAGLPAIRRWLAELDPLDPRHAICTFEDTDR